MSVNTRRLLVSLVTGALVAAVGLTSWCTGSNAILDAGGVRLSHPRFSQGALVVAAVGAGTLGLVLRRNRPLATGASAVGIALCAGAALMLGQWSLALGPHGLRDDPLLDVSGWRDITTEIRSVTVRALAESGAPRLLDIGLSDGRVATLHDVDSVALLAAAMGKHDVRPTFGVGATSPARATLDSYLTASAENYQNLEPYLALFRTGQASAGFLHATALQIEGNRQRHDSLRGPMLRIVAEALRALPAFLPTEAEERFLRTKLEERVGEESRLMQAVLEAEQLESLDGLAALTGYLDDPSYRVRLLAVQSLQSLVSSHSYPQVGGGGVPTAGQRGEWTRLADAWQGWLAEHADELVFVAGQWRLRGPQVDILAWSACAQEDLDCVGRLVGFLEHSDPQARRSVSLQLRRLVCSDQHPSVNEPDYPLDQEWQAYAGAWRTWLHTSRGALIWRRCEDGGREGWGRQE